MNNIVKKTILLSSATLLFFPVYPQSYDWVSSTENKVWQATKVKAQSSAQQTPLLEVNGIEEGMEFTAWGTCFNELGWDALNVLTRDEQETILHKLYHPAGDLRFTVGRIPMNASDYARDWYSCDEVPGDFQLHYFNIERDKQVLIPYIRSAQKYNPDLTFWISPWSPPGWMKINQDYPVRSSEYNNMSVRSDIALFEGDTVREQGLFPATLAANDYFIQDPRYLQSYASYFCKFIDAYKAQDIPISMVMYQNEAYSYTPYPGCAWTPEGTIRFNMEYLAPALKKHHPEVSLYMGTINTNRYDLVDQILSDPRMPDNIRGVGFQWEGGDILPRIRAKYPQYRYMQTESECGWGSFDWGGAEHTFGLMNHYLGNGCDEYIFWNVILCDEGMSTWGWKQNALIRVDSEARTVTYTPEYYAAMHYCNYITPGSRILAFENSKKDKTPVLVCRTPQNKYVVIAGNFNDEPKEITIRVENRYLNISLLPHSFNTFGEK